MEDYGICNLSIIPMREEPSDSSEMTSQLLIGECFEVLESVERWSRVRNLYDGYEGWISNKQWEAVPAERLADYTGDFLPLAADPVGLAECVDDRAKYPLMMGSVLPGYENGIFTLNEKKFRYNGSVTMGLRDREFMKKTALMFSNTPYLWGGRGFFGIDCSGFTQLVYKLAGCRIARNAAEQVKEGVPLSFVEEAEPGDLAFFDNEEGRIIHVGILLGDFKIIHASGKVRIDGIDQTGIFNAEKGIHTHRLRVIKQIRRD